MMNDFRAALRPALTLLLGFAVLLGLLYPLLITGIGQVALPHQANGSLVREGDRVVGSDLVGQAFTSAGYFNSRPSAAGDGYDGAASSGSNLGPTSQALVDRVSEAAPATGLSGNIPADLVTASGSGLDPHLSPAAAEAQASRVAEARGLPVEQVRALIRQNMLAPLAGVLGEPRVHVLRLNRQLDQVAPRSTGASPRP